LERKGRGSKANLGKQLKDFGGKAVKTTPKRVWVFKIVLRGKTTAPIETPTQCIETMPKTTKSRLRRD
jgi:hypothetical protein